MKREWAYRSATKLAALARRFYPLVETTPLDPVRAWSKTREVPEVASQTFHDYWRERKAAMK